MLYLSLYSAFPLCPSIKFHNFLLKGLAHSFLDLFLGTFHRLLEFWGEVWLLLELSHLWTSGSITWWPSTQRSCHLYQGPVKSQELFSNVWQLPAEEGMALYWTPRQLCCEGPSGACSWASLCAELRTTGRPGPWGPGVRAAGPGDWNGCRTFSSSEPHSAWPVIQKVGPGSTHAGHVGGFQSSESAPHRGCVSSLDCASHS